MQRIIYNRFKNKFDADENLTSTMAQKKPPNLCKEAAKDLEQAAAKINIHLKADILITGESGS